MDVRSIHLKTASIEEFVNTLPCLKDNQSVRNRWNDQGDNYTKVSRRGSLSIKS